MTDKQHAEIIRALADVRAALMTKEMTDDGWDLRDEMLALTEAVSNLAVAVHSGKAQV